MKQANLQRSRKVQPGAQPEGNPRISALLCLLLFAMPLATAQQLNEASVVRQVDDAVQSRVEHVEDFTDKEHYAVYRGKDESHPVAEMTVRTIYRRGVGKTYTILAESGSSIIRKFGLMPLLENEKTINQPGNVAQSWFTSANYQMHLKSGEAQSLDGRECLILSINPKRKAPNMIEGTMWVDAKDYSIAQVDGVASKSPSVWAGTTHMMRRYMNISGYPMATHARAEASSLLFGRTVVTIDYQEYRIQVRPGR